MKGLNESFKINTETNIRELIIKSGEKLNWKSVKITDNSVEFQYSKHLTKFLTIVSWSGDGFINLSSNYKMDNVKVDLGGYRKNHNEKIKLSILRELSLQERNTSPDQIQLDENKNAEENNKTNEFSRKIAEKDKSQNKLIVIAAIVSAIVVFGFFLIGNSNNSSSGLSACECSQRWLATPKSMMKSTDKWKYDECVRKYGGFAGANEACIESN